MALLHPNSLVNALFEACTTQWNHRLVHQIFLLEDAAVICQIPTSIFGSSDQQVWWYSKEGYYTVRSAYFLELSRHK